jgi:hypothetical protein
MNSTAYRQASRRETASEAVDSENKLYWRMNVRRLDGEALRDSVLAVSGKLNDKPFGPPVPVMADRVGQIVIGIENLNAGRPGAEIPLHGEEFRRSIYVQVRRSRPLAVLETFDQPAMAPNCTARTTSTVALQSLLMMNGGFATGYSRAFAERIAREAGEDLKEQLAAAWRLALARRPNDDELAAAEAFVRQQQEHYADNPDELQPEKKGEAAPTAQIAALANVCHALLSCNEFMYVD